MEFNYRDLASSLHTLVRWLDKRHPLAFSIPSVSGKGNLGVLGSLSISPPVSSLLFVLSFYSLAHRGARACIVSDYRRACTCIVDSNFSYTLARARAHTGKGHAVDSVFNACPHERITVVITTRQVSLYADVRPFLYADTIIRLFLLFSSTYRVFLTLFFSISSLFFSPFIFLAFLSLFLFFCFLRFSFLVGFFLPWSFYPSALNN